ncbi:MAG: SH3 domain-containing protein [Lachnospiraceae bacterium]|nr:SH3 domain-containing protein [Lachnospiraceae bacterium]
MIFNKTRIVAGLLSIALLVTVFDMTVFAVEMDKILPVAGLDLTLNEGVSMKEVVEERGLDTENEYYIVEPTDIVKKEMVDAVREDYSNLVIADVNDYVNIRSIPSEDGEIVGKLYDNSVGDFLEEENGWYKIESGNCIGYVKAEYCVTGEAANELAKEVGRRTAIVTTETLNVRKEPNNGAAVIGQVPCEEVLTVTDEAGNWIEIKIEEGYGYVSLEYVTLSIEFVKAESREEEKARLEKERAEREAALAASRKAQEAAAAAAAEEAAKIQEIAASLPAGDTSLGQQVADYALQFVGNPYVYGGTSLTNGADCSGFTLAVYANFGVALPHSSAAQNKKGTNVGSVANAVPGDIIYYSGHVGIYIGNEQIVHASNSRTGIIVSNVYYDKVLGVRRIF